MICDAIQQERLYIEYHPKVLGYIASRVRNHSDAEDLAATVFLKVYRALPDFDAEKASLSTWIYTITRNTVIDHFRRNSTDVPLCDIEASPESVDESLIRQELLDTLASALERMDERERDLIVLHYYRQQTLGEIAKLMNISYSYVKVLHKKALEELKKVFK